eukprot:COSAG02_NODE_989_length_15437_cov_95.731860_5_plen_764_part_00
MCVRARACACVGWWQGTNALCHFIDRTDAWTPATGAISNCGYSAAGALTVGHLSIATSPAPALGNVFMASQNAANATVTVAVPLAGGGMLHTETIIARAENVLIVTLWTSGTNTEIGVNASIPKLPNGGCYWSDQDVVNNSVVTWRQIGAAYQDQIHSTVGLRRSVKYAISVASPDGAVCRDADGIALICVPKVSSKHRATVVVTVVHNYDLGFEDPIRPAANLTNALTMRGGGGEAALAELRADHSRWWADFWRRTSYVYMPGSPAAEKLWYGSLYILASGNREEPTRLAAGRYAGDGRLPPPMGLVWPKTSDTPAFSGSYTMNYVRSHLLTKKLPVEHANVPSQNFRYLLPYHSSSCLRHAMQNQQGIYFGVHAANASWLGLANEQAMLEYIPRGHMDARAQFNCSGINMDCEIFAWGQTTTTVGDQGQRSNAALTAVQFANHWLYTRDVKWLKTHYTFPREVIAFFTDYLTLEADGKYHSLNDCLNELCSGDLGDHVESLIRNDDPHVTIGLLRFLFPVVVEMAQTLGVDADQIPKWRHIGTNLAPYVDVAQPGNNTNGARIYGRFRGALHAPRQNTQLTFSASWPGYDPELNSNATLRQLDNATAIYMQSFTCGNCFPLFPPGAVRSGVAVDATWHSSLAAIDCGWQENMLLRDGCNGMATEAIGGMAVTSEALLGQGQHGWLALFPGLPLVQAAAFRNLRALGGLLVSARRSSGGVISNVIVTNDAGDGHAKTVALHSPWGGATPLTRLPKARAATGN